jgi:hypothetical protein
LNPISHNKKMFLLQPETRRDDLCDLAALREKVAVAVNNEK